jgi:hypothetical protein
VPEKFKQVQQNPTYPDNGYPNRLGASESFVENSTKLTFLEIAGDRIKYSKVLWLLELQIRHRRKVQIQARTVNSNSRNSNCLVA